MPQAQPIRSTHGAVSGAQPGADPDGGLSTGLALEEVLLLYKQSGHKKLHLRYALEAGHIEDKRITLKAFQDAHHIKAVFQRLALFATECEQNVSARFPAAGVFKHFDIFEDDWEFSQAGLSASAKAFADFFKLLLPDLRKELSVLFAAREAARQGGSSAWPAVLHRVADQRLTHALKVAGAFLLMMSQSAENERVFARVERLKSCLGEQGDGQLFEQYLWAQNGPTACAAGPGKSKTRLFAIHRVLARAGEEQRHVGDEVHHREFAAVLTY